MNDSVKVSAFSGIDQVCNQFPQQAKDVQCLTGKKLFHIARDIEASCMLKLKDCVVHLTCL